MKKRKMEKLEPCSTDNTKEKEQEDLVAPDCIEEKEHSTSTRRSNRSQPTATDKKQTRTQNTCHQCKRNDKGRVVWCTKCNAKRFCVPCMTKWYPDMSEEDFAEECPVCRRNCNCKACLRLERKVETHKNLEKFEPKYSKEDRVLFSKYILQSLLTFLKTFNEEQLVEKEMEAKIQDRPLSELNVEQAKCEAAERVYCNFCQTSIVDFHRSCPKCCYELCLTCCRELREGHLRGGDKGVEMQFVDKGFDYLHGGKETSKGSLSKDKVTTATDSEVLAEPPISSVFVHNDDVKVKSEPKANPDGREETSKGFLSEDKVITASDSEIAAEPPTSNIIVRNDNVKVKSEWKANPDGGEETTKGFLSEDMVTTATDSEIPAEPPISSVIVGNDDVKVKSEWKANPDGGEEISGGFLSEDKVTTASDSEVPAEPTINRVIVHNHDVKLKSEWKANPDGSIPCPDKDWGGCGQGILELKTMFQKDWVSDLLVRAEEKVSQYEVDDKHALFPPRCPNSNEAGEVDDKNNANLRKASSREDSDDNYLFCPEATDLKDFDLKLFQWHWYKGEPVIVRDVLKTTLGLSWEPMVMWRAFRQVKSGNHHKQLDVIAVNCLDWCEVPVNIHYFFNCYLEGAVDEKGWPMILKLKDWPPSCLFDEHLPRHGAEFISCLPFKHYTHPRKGIFNLVKNIPEVDLKPDLGPKTYIAYGIPQELERGDSVTKLHCDMSDAVNVLTHTAKMKFNAKTLKTVEKLKKQHRAQDEREIYGSKITRHQAVEELMPSMEIKDNKVDVKGGDEENSSVQSCVNGKNDSVIKSESDDCDPCTQRVYQVDSKEDKPFEGSTGAGSQDLNQPASSLQLQKELNGYEDSEGSALWDIFRREDVPKLEEYLRKYFHEFRHIHLSPLSQIVHPIHDQTIYLTTEHKRRLKKEYGIEPWTFVQNLGDAVFIPAGCPHQVRNLKSCIKVAMDFVSPENVNQCLRLTEEIRLLPQNHRAKEDKLEVKKMSLYAVQDALMDIENPDRHELAPKPPSTAEGGRKGRKRKHSG